MDEPHHGSPEWFRMRINQTREDMKTWPQWMRDGSVAVAAFPFIPEPPKED